jgi:sodium transport system permease protein
MNARILAVAGKEIVDAARDRRTLLVTLLSAALAGPIFLMLIFSMMANQQERARELKLPVVNAAGAPALIAFLERQQVSIVPAPEAYEAKIRAGDTDIVLIVDEKFGEDVAAGKAGIVRVVYDRSRDRSQSAIGEVESLLRAYNRQWGQQRLVLRGVAPEAGNPLDVQPINLATPRQSGALVLFLVAYYGLFAAVVGGMALALDATAGERERSSLEPLLMTPATPLELATGKWLAIAVFNGLVVFVTLAGFYLTLGFAPLPAVGIPFLFGVKDFARFLVVLLPLILLMPAILLWLGSRGRTIKEAQANTSLLLFVVGVIPAVQLFMQRKEPEWLVAVPVSGQYTLLNRVLRGDGLALADVALSYVIPAVLIALALFAVGRLWSRESVLAGK